MAAASAPELRRRPQAGAGPGACLCALLGWMQACVLTRSKGHRPLALPFLARTTATSHSQVFDYPAAHLLDCH